MQWWSGWYWHGIHGNSRDKLISSWWLHKLDNSRLYLVPYPRETFYRAQNTTKSFSDVPDPNVELTAHSQSLQLAEIFSPIGRRYSIPVPLVSTNPGDATAFRCENVDGTSSNSLSVRALHRFWRSIRQKTDAILKNEYDVITLLRMVRFRQNLVDRCRMTCRRWRKRKNRNRKYNSNMAYVCFQKPIPIKPVNVEHNWPDNVFKLLLVVEMNLITVFRSH